MNIGLNVDGKIYRIHGLCAYMGIKYRIPSNKHYASNRRHPLISATPLGIHIRRSTSL